MIFEIISALFDACILFLYFGKMLGKRKETFPVYLYISLFLITEVLLTVISNFYNNEHDNLRFYLTITVSAVTTFLLTFLHDSTLRHRLFVTFSFQVYATISELLVFLFVSILPVDISSHILEDDTYGTACSKIVLFILLNITMLLWRRKKTPYSLQYSLLVLIMPIISLVLLTTFSAQSDAGTTQTVLHIVGMAGLLFANVANYFLLNNILKVSELQQTDLQQKRQLEFQAEKYQQISTVYRNSRKLIHDMKKHFFFINHCVENEEYSAITPYINNAIQDIEKSHNRVNTGNLVIDAFVSNHMTIAEQENIEFYSDIQILKHNIEIRDYDLSVVLGNLLDNALNACRKIQIPAPRQISVEIFTTNMECVIHIANSVLPQPHRDSKHDSDELYHGYGTKNVAAIVEQYMGTYTHYIEQDKYHCIISIPCNIN